MPTTERISRSIRRNMQLIMHEYCIDAARALAIAKLIKGKIIMTD
jgi:hypothetical protein